MKSALVLAGTLLLAGCASAPRPQISIMPSYTKSAKVVQPAPTPVVVPETQKPATFKDRWQEFKKKHPIKWTHQ